jgi:hypothetical protein
MIAKGSKVNARPSRCWDERLASVRDASGMVSMPKGMGPPRD